MFTIIIERKENDANADDVTTIFKGMVTRYLVKTLWNNIVRQKCQL